ncbi:MAG TPA: hypothetical protein VE999_14850 [Gemmataceae bacterium]|nr:hypothetical protein [Gemmataceae bacterium]
MTQVPIRIKVRCTSCRTSFRLSQEQYRELVKRSRVDLDCPHCGSGFEYSPLTAVVATSPPVRSRPHRPEAEVVLEPAPEPLAPMAPPPAPAPQFPPPPFAPLAAGTPATANAAPPPFAPLAGMPAAPAQAASFPQRASAPTGGETKKLTLNERWKQLPPWVQWMVIGVLIVILAVIIFAMPTGGGG